MANDEVTEVRSLAKQVRVPAIVLGAVVAALVVKSMFSVEVEAGTVRVPLNFGSSVVDRVLTEGLNPVMPWQTTTVWPTRTFTESRDVLPRDSNKQQITARVSVQLTINPAATPALKRQIGDLPYVLSTIVDPQIQYVTAANTPRRSPEKLVGERPALVGDIRHELQSAISAQLKEKGVQEDAIRVGLVGITQFEFNPQFVQTVEARAEADVKKQTAAVQKQIDITNADRDGQVREILATAEAQRTQDIADATAYAARVKGDALAATRDLPLFEAVSNWKGHTARMQLGPNSQVLVNPTAPAKQ